MSVVFSLTGLVQDGCLINKLVKNKMFVTLYVLYINNIVKYIIKCIFITYSDIFVSTHCCPFFSFPIWVNTCYTICNHSWMQNLSLSHTHTHTLSWVLWISLCLKYLHKYTEILVFNENNWLLPSQKCNITIISVAKNRDDTTCTSFC